MEGQADPVELRVQLSEARTDTKFAELLGELRMSESRMDKQFTELNGRLDHLEKTTYGVKTTIVGTGIAIVAVLVGVLSYGQSWFGLGLSNRDTIRAIVAEYASQHPVPLAAPVQGR